MNRHWKAMACAAVAAGVLAAARPAFAAAAPAGPVEAKTGLAAALADDDRLIGELVRRNLTGLRDYVFDKKSISPEQRQVYLIPVVVKQLTDPAAKMTPRQRQDGWRAVASGIEQALGVLKNDVELMDLAGKLAKEGTEHDLNLLEYWGEDPKRQAHLRPMAEAVSKVYARGVEAAKARLKRVEDEIGRAGGGNKALEDAYTQAENMILIGQFSLGFNQYTVALSIDRTDPARAQACDKGMEVLAEFAEDPETFGDHAIQASVGIAKLNMAKGTPESLQRSKALFQEILKNPKSPWGSKFQATYFSVVCDIVGKNLAEAKKGPDAVEAWLKQNPPPSADMMQGMTPAIQMLRFRIHTLEGELARDDAGRKQANDAAVAVLQQLQKDFPALTGIINEQMISRLPDQPDVAQLNSLLLQALLSRGYDEVRKEEGQALDKKALGQAVTAAQELIRRAGKDPSVKQEDAAEALLLMGVFHRRLDQDLEAARAFMDYLEKYNANVDEAFYNARLSLAKLAPSPSSPQEVRKVYERFLDWATGPRGGHPEFGFEYALLLVKRNSAVIEAANFSDAQGKQMLADAEKAVRLLQNVAPEKKLFARYYEMRASEHIVELAPTAPGVAQWSKRIIALGDEVSKLADAQMAAAPDEEAKAKLRGLRVETTLRVVKMAQREQGPGRAQSIDQALTMLAGIEQDVQKMPEMMPTWLTLRVQGMLSLGRAEQAVGDLKKLVETQGEKSLDILVSVVQALDRDFELAKRQKDARRQTELAGHRSQVAQAVVDVARASSNPKVKQLLPGYERFLIEAKEMYAELEQDPQKRQEILNGVLTEYRNQLQKTPGDKLLALKVANVQMQMGDFLPAQKVYLEYINKGYVGTGKVMQSTADGPTMVWNDVYWEVMYKLLRCNVEMAQRQVAGVDHAQALQSTKDQLKRVYVLYDKEPGGPKWFPEFEKLRQELIPDWSPDAVPTSQATTQPVG